MCARTCSLIRPHAIVQLARARRMQHNAQRLTISNEDLADMWHMLTSDQSTANSESDPDVVCSRGRVVFFFSSFLSFFLSSQFISFSFFFFFFFFFLFFSFFFFSPFLKTRKSRLPRRWTTSNFARFGSRSTPTGQNFRRFLRLRSSFFSATTTASSVSTPFSTSLCERSDS